MLASSPQPYHGHEELKKTVEEDFSEVIADLGALLKTTVLSSTFKAGCFWRLFCTLPSLLPFPHFSKLPLLQPESTFPGPLRLKAAGLEERTMRKHSLYLCRRVAPSFYCCFSLDWAWWGIYSSQAGLPSSGDFYIWD